MCMLSNGPTIIDNYRSVIEPIKAHPGCRDQDDGLFEYVDRCVAKQLQYAADDATGRAGFGRGSFPGKGYVAECY